MVTGNTSAAREFASDTVGQTFLSATGSDHAIHRVCSARASTPPHCKLEEARMPAPPARTVNLFVGWAYPPTDVAVIGAKWWASTPTLRRILALSV